MRAWCGRRTRSVPIPSRSASAWHGARNGSRWISGGVPTATACAALLVDADLLVDGHPPRVLGNAGLGVDALTDAFPALSVLRVAAFVDGDRPGYGPAAEARGGWAARHDPPRLGRSSVADPVAGLLGALVAVELLTARAPGDRARISLEGAVGHLLGAGAVR